MAMLKNAGLTTGPIDLLGQALAYTAQCVAESRRRVRQSHLSLLKAQSQLTEDLARLAASRAILAGLAEDGYARDGTSGS